MADANSKIKSMLEELTESGKEIGLQVAAYLNGELVIDTWAGVADPTTGKLVEEDTLFLVASCTKGITATCIHILAERGLLEYDTPIPQVWPEFAKNGKDKITIRHALTHEAGIPQMPTGLQPETLCDWDKMCKAIANLKPLWEPGTKTGYHAATYGWILGEIARRVDGRSLTEFIQEEICSPLDIKDLYVGIPDEVEERIALYTAAPPLAGAPSPPADLLAIQAVPPNLFNPDVINRGDFRRACVPASNGIMTARALARHYAVLAEGGELDGVRILSPERLVQATQLHTDAYDEVMGPVPGSTQPIRKALGYFLGGPCKPSNNYRAALGESQFTFGNPGAGGMIAFADPQQRFSFAFLKNFMPAGGSTEPDSAYKVAQAVRAELNLVG